MEWERLVGAWAGGRIVCSSSPPFPQAQGLPLSLSLHFLGLGPPGSLPPPPPPPTRTCHQPRPWAVPSHQLSSWNLRGQT